MRVIFLILGSVLFAACDAGVNVTDQASNSFTTPSGVVLTFLNRTAPDFPAAARLARLQGAVQVQFTIQADGTVSDLLIVRSADPVLDRLVLDAVG